MKWQIRIVTALLALLSSVAAQGGLFGSSKETKLYKKHRDVARLAWKNEQLDLAKTNFLAAHEALAKKGFKSTYYRESLINLAYLFADRGEPYRSEPYLETLRDYYVKRRGTNNVDVGEAFLLLGQCQRDLYKFEEAEESLKRAEHIARWKLGRYSVAAGYTKAILGQLYVRMKRDQEAIGLLEAGLQQMGKFRTSTRYVDQFGSYRRVEKQASYRPDPLEVADVLIDYAVSLYAVGRKAEGEKALEQVRQQIKRHNPKSSGYYYTFVQLGHTLEARGDLSEAEKHFYSAAKLVWNSKELDKKQKLRGNELVMQFHVRQGQDSKAGTQEGILFAAGISEDYLDQLNIRAEELSYARTGGPHKKH